MPEDVLRHEAIVGVLGSRERLVLAEGDEDELHAVLNLLGAPILGHDRKQVRFHSQHKRHAVRAHVRRHPWPRTPCATILLIRVEKELEAELGPSLKPHGATRARFEDEPRAMGRRDERLREVLACQPARSGRAPERLHVHVRVAMMAQQKAVVDDGAVARAANHSLGRVWVDIEGVALKFRTSLREDEGRVLRHLEVATAAAAIKGLHILAARSAKDGRATPAHGAQHEAIGAAFGERRGRGRRRGRRRRWWRRWWWRGRWRRWRRRRGRQRWWRGWWRRGRRRSWGWRWRRGRGRGRVKVDWCRDEADRT